MENHGNINVEFDNRLPGTIYHGSCGMAQDSIDILSLENKRLIEDLTTVNREVVALRKENGELKTAVDKLCQENSQLKTEVQDLRKQLTQAPA